MCSEQGKLPAAKAFKLAERDKHMSEEKKSFMQELDQWTDDNVIDPLLDTGFEEFDSEALKQRVGRIKQAIRQKVLESYRNGQGVKSQPARKEPRR